MNRKFFPYLSLAMLLVGSLLLLLGSSRPIAIRIDGVQIVKESRAFTVNQALQDAGIIPGELDTISPAPGQWLGWYGAIKVDRARQTELWIDAQQFPFQTTTTERLPANILAEAKIKLYPGDLVLWNGAPLDPLQPLGPAEFYSLQYISASPLRLQQEQRSFTASGAGTLGDLLFTNNIPLTTADQVTASLNDPVSNMQSVSVRQAAPLQILVNNGAIDTYAAAATVGEALAQAGVPVQGLDYSIPEATAPLPENGKVRVVHVREEIILTQDTIPFEKEFVAAPELVLDQVSPLSSGEYGVQVSRQRVRFEDGEESNRETEAEWIAKQPVPQQVGYGTQIEVMTTSTPDGAIEYWRAVNVYATSYSPCRSGTEKCYYGTSYGLPVQRGVIGVTSAWYSWMAGQRVYVPGYGFAVIADVGGGISGKQWIDLGFSDEDYEPWSQNVTMYFLTPIPESIPWTLP
jgi:resuscitation-promoting factor RpfB